MTAYSRRRTPATARRRARVGRSPARPKRPQDCALRRGSSLVTPVHVEPQAQRGEDARQDVKSYGWLAVLHSVDGAHGDVRDQRERALIHALAVALFAYAQADLLGSR